MARIDLKNVGQNYGAKHDDAFAIADLNLTWEDGSANALLGPSGCGKTTLLNMISGLLTPTSGNILLDGEDVTKLDARERRIAQVFQFPVVYETLSVFENLAFPLRNDGLRGQPVTDRVHAIAEELDLTSVLKQKASRLSPAEKQLVSLGRGIVRENTAAVLLDEPLTVIDPKRRWHIRRILRQVQRDLNMTMIYVTHDQQEALTFADNVTIMHDGEVLQHASPETLYHAPAAPFVGYFLGSPGMNLIDGEYRDGHVHAAEATFPYQGDEFSNGDLVTLGIRPECVEVGEAQDALPCIVSVIEDHGPYRIATTDLNGATLRARVATSMGIELGAPLPLRFPAEHIRVFPRATVDVAR